MINALILATIIHARAELIARAVIWGTMNDHPAIEFDHCLRVRPRSKCVAERNENNRRACRFILKERCKYANH